MKAVIVTGGKQYTVAEGDVLYIESFYIIYKKEKFEKIFSVKANIYFLRLDVKTLLESILIIAVGEFCPPLCL